MNEWEWQILEEKIPLTHLTVGTTEVQVGGRVRLSPRQGGDVLDMALRGQIAIIESIEQDYEGKNHVCVVLEDDPGRDLGLLRQPGHRFFFDATEIEPLHEFEPGRRANGERPSVLVAGIGNIFLGDDGFGVEVIKRLAKRELPPGVRVVDFGIRGLDLAYALQDGYETSILVDAYAHGQPPGTVSLVEPDLKDLDSSEQGLIESHGMDPVNVLRMASANGPLKRVLVVGCEPATFGGEEGQMGMSDVVTKSVDEAVSLVLSTIEKILQKQM